MKQAFVFAVALCVATVFVAAGRGADDAADAKQALPLALAAQPPVSLDPWTPDRISAELTVMKHAGYDSGFNAVMLPFSYEDHTTKTDGDADEANALAFLISNDLDWSPAAYCSRHAYFVYKRDPQRIAALRKKYDPESISALIADWTATHAVGARLIKSDDGYSGELDIYDRNGDRVFKQTFDDPRPFFDLLGDMSIEAMTFLGPKPPDELVKHLHIKRCKKQESIAELGHAAFMPYRSRLEFDTLAKVLVADPGFSDVRIWVANQARWMGMGQDAKVLQDAAALDSYLTSEGVRCFDYVNCPEAYLEKLPAWRAKAATLWGADSPKAIANSVAPAVKQKHIPTTLLSAGAKAMAAYPNDYESAQQIGRAFIYAESDSPDPDLSTSLFCTVLYDRYQTGVGDKSDSTLPIADNLIEIGRSDIAAAVLLTTDMQRDDRNIAWCLSSLQDIGQYDAVLAIYDKYKAGLSTNRADSALHAAEAAAMLGKADVLEKIATDAHKSLVEGNMLALVQAYQDVLARRPVDDQKLTTGLGSKNGWLAYHYLMFLSQMDLGRHKTDYLPKLTREITVAPNERPCWLLLDGYDRQTPMPERADFYRTLHWLYPDDPWVKLAVTAWRERCPNDAAGQADVAPVDKALQPYAPQRWTFDGKHVDEQVLAETKASTTPWQVTAAIAELTTKHQYDKALDLSLRYQNFASQAKIYDLRYWSNHLAYKVEACRAQ